MGAAGTIFFSKKGGGTVPERVYATGTNKTHVSLTTTVSSTTLNEPAGVALDGAGNLYIADEGNERVLELNAVTGTLTTVAGQVGISGTGGNSGPATSATLSHPYGLAVDGAGNLYIADLGNNCIRKVDVMTSSRSFAPTNLGTQSSDSPGR